MPNNSQLNNIFLIGLCNSDDLKTESTDFNDIWRLMCHEIKHLETEGINVTETIKLKGTLVVTSGDNIGLNQSLGFAESFSANYYCRVCELPKRICQTICEEDPSSLSWNTLSDTENQPNTPDPWGQMTIYKIKRRRLGQRLLTSTEEKQCTIDLVKEKTTFGRNGDCNISAYIEPIKMSEVSNIHFAITKKDVNDQYCPVFVEDFSKNGTFFCQQKINTNNETNQGITFQQIDKNTKKRIISHKVCIYIERHQPSIYFVYHSLQQVVSPSFLPKDIHAEYHIGHELGHGACGKVYFVQNRTTCLPFALKYASNEINQIPMKSILQEIEILKKIKHPCILELYSVNTYVDSVAIFLHYMDGGDLFSRIQKNKPFSEELTKFIFYQICCGVEYLHKQNVTHRDLKPANILLATPDEYTLIKISDFGLSKCVTNLNSILKTQCGTRHYIAPEIKNKQRPYTNKVDMWSLGVILYNCFTGEYPFDDDDDNDGTSNEELRFTNGQLWNNVSDEAKNILRETLKFKADDRPAVSILLNERKWLSKENDAIIKKAIEIVKNSNKTKSPQKKLETAYRN
ncbi:ovarian-specific serine/threonine-protein kinase Lok-like [Contarinia nasturtii]|uniref:ovarian-specific serine/threonine-protein kinase Lok-like n=1 Tax=Contarinia nasturtii TaxID=265458 RepID=UPI0012D44A20|nr:ovarian-specific serine/threonine-protein kinase Lok-like [Contarinia nasturtii]